MGDASFTRSRTSSASPISSPTRTSPFVPGKDAVEIVKHCPGAGRLADDFKPFQVISPRSPFGFELRKGTNCSSEGQSFFTPQHGASQPARFEVWVGAG
jgi:hypothetical protein